MAQDPHDRIRSLYNKLEKALKATLDTNEHSAEHAIVSLISSRMGFELSMNPDARNKALKNIRADEEHHQ